MSCYGYKYGGVDNDSDLHVTITGEPAQNLTCATLRTINNDTPLVVERTQVTNGNFTTSHSYSYFNDCYISGDIVLAPPPSAPGVPQILVLRRTRVDGTIRIDGERAALPVLLNDIYSHVHIDPPWETCRQFQIPNID
jgi:hypothetical protein